MTSGARPAFRFLLVVCLLSYNLFEFSGSRDAAVPSSFTGREGHPLAFAGRLALAAAG